jgi:hypothetical protein
MNKRIPDEPWNELRFGEWEVNIPSDQKVTINIGANQTIEIDKLYGPLAALGVRIRLEYANDKSDWVVEREKISSNGAESEWIEMTRWDCQMDWPEGGDESI